MLTHLVEGAVSSNFILIQDDAKQNGNSLLEAFTSYRLKMGKNLHMLLYDKPEKNNLRISNLRQMQNSNITFYDGFKDPLNWFNSDVSDDVLLTYDINKALSRIAEGTVILNSLTPLLLNSSSMDLYKAIHRFLGSSKNSQLIALIHIDVHEESEIKLLEHLATTVIRLIPSSGNLNSTFCSILHRKPNGKIVHKTELFNVSQDGDLHTEDVEKRGVKEQAKRYDPTSNLTFNLNLKDDEKKAREKLVLPYTSAMQQSGGEITYHLDEVDDFDEDDPDDDLNV